jgi:RHS repeat-associated protein
VIETSYGYDPAGNRLNMTTNRPEQGPPGAPVTTVYSYNEANWLLAAGNQQSAVSYSYDNNGNRIQAVRSSSPPGPPQDVIESYQYDFENRLIEYERTGDGAIRRAFLEYDGLGRRFAKGTQQACTEPCRRGGGNVFWTQYAYRQLSMDPLAEYPQTGPPRETYLYRGRAGTLIGMEEQQGGGAGKEYWFSQDGLGNIATVTKHSGQSAHDYFYDPYGNIIDNNGRPEDASNWTDPHNHYLLNGKEWDEEMRLHYFGARYYDSAAGVWLTQDIYRGGPRQPLTLHRTLYVLANPVNRVDAYGYMAEIYANGFGGAGGGSEPVRTTNPTVPNATNPQNAPYHFESTGRDDLYFNDYSVDFHVPAAATVERFADSPWACTGSGFCLMESGYSGPDPYLEVGFYVDNFDYAGMLAWYNSNGDTLSFMGGVRRSPFTGQPLSLRDSMMYDIAELDFLISMRSYQTEDNWQSPFPPVGTWVSHGYSAGLAASDLSRGRQMIQG